MSVWVFMYVCVSDDSALYFPAKQMLFSSSVWRNAHGVLHGTFGILTFPIIHTEKSSNHKDRQGTLLNLGWEGGRRDKGMEN